MTDINIDNLSDEEFMKLDLASLEPPKIEKSEEHPKAEDNQVEDNLDNKEENKTDDNQSDDANGNEPDGKSDDDNKSDDDSSDGSKPDDKSDEKKKESDEKSDDKSADAGAKADNKAEGNKTESQEVKTELKPEDFENFYKTVMKPFKANGKIIELKSPEEAIRLMQAGAGYGKRLQEIQPHLKTVRMLEKHGILDVNKLSYLIDLNNHNTDAIKKLVKESGIDPLDLSNEDAVTYRQSNHSITDQENNFKEILDELSSHPQGNETLKIINQEWDAVSKQFLFTSPEVLRVIQSQRDDGTYDIIKAEIDRQRAIGSIKPNTPFVQAYKTVGDALVAKGELSKTNQNVVENPEPVEANKVIIDTKVAAVKSQASNDEKAKAASSTTSVSKKAVVKVNPLSLADEDFLNSFDIKF